MQQRVLMTSCSLSSWLANNCLPYICPKFKTMVLATNGKISFCWSWYDIIGVSDSPVGPTANLCYEYRTVLRRHILVDPKHIDAMHNLPLRSLSATLKNLALGFFSSDSNFPSSVTSQILLSIASLGTLTWSNISLPLSIGFSPILTPMSSIMTPFAGFMLSSRIVTMKLLTPSFLPFTIVWAKTMAWFAWQAPFVIQYFWEAVVGELIVNYFEVLSKVAVVSILGALLPYPSSVKQKHPITFKLSTLRMNGKCRSVWRAIRVPPNRLNCTVNLVARPPSIWPSISWAVKMLIGSF